MRQALRDPGRATRIVSPSFGDMPFEDLVSRMVCSDTLVHTWDLARARQVRTSTSTNTRWRWPGPGCSRPARPCAGSGVFGPAVEPPDGADTQTKLLCFLGRAV